jgi:HPt (histidine-containing phosphotransfer) domain-containing protein
MARVAPERAGSAPAVDEAVFSRLVVDLGAQHIGEVCRLYLENAASGIDAVRRALDAGDADGAAQAAHRLKSASGFLGATRLADLCAAVEGGSPPGNPGDALVAELRRASQDLDLLVGRVAGAGP